MKTTKILFLAAALMAGQSLTAQSISVGNPQAEAKEDVTVSFSELPENAVINLYQDAAMLPLKASLQVTEASGDWHTGEVLEPGNYRVVAESAEGETIAQTTLKVKDIPFATEPFTMLLVSDIHVMNPELLINDGAAFLKEVNSDRKMMAESARAFDALIDTILLYKPQLVLIPGDLTKDGEKISHEYVAAGLARLKDAGIASLVVPGNHDINNPYAAAYDGDNKVKVEYVSDKDFAEIYSQFGYDANSVCDTASLSYITEPTPGLCVLGIDATQFYNNKHKSNGDEADVRINGGRFLKSTLQWVIDRADEAMAADKRVIAMMHHQIVEHFDNETSMLSTAILSEADTIAPLLMKHGIHLMMTGHVHISDIAVGYNKEHTDSIVDIATGSTITYPAHYRWLQLTNGFSQLSVNTRMIRSIKDIDDYTLYGRKHFEDRVPVIMGVYVRNYADKIFNTMQSVQSVPFVSKLVAVMPSTPEAMAEWLEQYMMEPLVIAYVTHSEGNEGLKNVELVEQMVYDAYDKMIDDLTQNGDFSKAEIFIYKTELKKIIVEMLNAPIQSLLNDCTEYGTQFANVTNDLFINVKIGEPVKTEALEEVKTNTDTIMDDAWYDVLGRRFTTRPTEGGVYIHQGRKVRI